MSVLSSGNSKNNIDILNGRLIPSVLKFPISWIITDLLAAVIYRILTGPGFSRGKMPYITGRHK